MMNAEGWSLRFNPWVDRLNGLAQEVDVPVMVAVVPDDEDKPQEFAVLIFAGSEEGVEVSPMSVGTGAETVANLWRIWAGITGMPEAAATN